MIRDHEDNKHAFSGPRLFIRAAELDMHPLDTRDDRKEFAKVEQGLGFCNITKCCTEVCPEHIKITDNAIIPMKERVVDNRYDPLVWLGRKIFRRDQLDAETTAHAVPPSRRSTMDVRVVPSGIKWHQPQAEGQDAAVGTDGRMPLTEATYGKAGAASPFGEDVPFPLPASDLTYQHPTDNSADGTAPPQH